MFPLQISFDLMTSCWLSLVRVRLHCLSYMSYGKCYLMLLIDIFHFCILSLTNILYKLHSVVYIAKSFWKELIFFFCTWDWVCFTTHRACCKPNRILKPNFPFWLQQSLKGAKMGKNWSQRVRPPWCISKKMKRKGENLFFGLAAKVLSNLVCNRPQVKKRVVKIVGRAILEDSSP